ncbi:MAG: dNTP triphosphohydrolase [Prevotella sp.]|jgi:dGTPase|nr:dNTP triphosphohydrolase [Prevotella sp.]
MLWEQLLSSKRLGMEEYHDARKHDRTEYQRDYDRLIFSAPFRRLQNKTQVFPLPGSIFVHNRLTHSLEVSCVGRSLGALAAKGLRQKYPRSEADFEEIGAIVAAACLAHDLGNPPFGHSGEKAISTYFSEGNGLALKKDVEKEGGRWSDFTHFEGNANSIRLLTHRFAGRRNGGFAMTYSTLAAIAKYPFSSELADISKGKFGFFQAEEADFEKIARELGLTMLQDKPAKYVRHPLVYLVEAADDICYQIMDMEDAHKLRIVPTETLKDFFLNFFPQERRERALKNMAIVSDINEQIAYLRSSIVGLLVNECVRAFLEREEDICKGTFGKSLIDHIAEEQRMAYKSCAAYSVAHIYRSQDVLDIELAGHRIITFLLDILIKAVKDPGQEYSKLLLRRIPEQFEVSDASLYTRVLAVLDFISGMTDVYALDLYRKITGMSLPAV